jgi:hypothetical protein
VGLRDGEHAVEEGLVLDRRRVVGVPEDGDAIRRRRERVILSNSVAPPSSANFVASSEKPI